KTIMYADKPCRIHVHGSSFAAGEGVSDGDTWEEKLAAHFCEPVKNFGVGGFSTYHELLRIKKEEEKDPAKYIILNIGNGDHVLNLVSWQRIRFRADFTKAFHTTVPYVSVDMDKGEVTEHSNPCPDTQSLYNLCDLDWLIKTFEND